MGLSLIRWPHDGSPPQVMAGSARYVAPARPARKNSFTIQPTTGICSSCRMNSRTVMLSRRHTNSRRQSARPADGSSRSGWALPRRRRHALRRPVAPGPRRPGRRPRHLTLPLPAVFRPTGPNDPRPDRPFREHVFPWTRKSHQRADMTEQRFSELASTAPAPLGFPHVPAERRGAVHGHQIH